MVFEAFDPLLVVSYILEAAFDGLDDGERRLLDFPQAGKLTLHAGEVILSGHRLADVIQVLFDCRHHAVELVLGDGLVAGELSGEKLLWFHKNVQKINVHCACVAAPDPMPALAAKPLSNP